MINKDFKKIAEIIKQERMNINESGLSESIVYYSNKSIYALIVQLSDYFKSIDPNFNEIKFKEACV